MMKAGQVVFVIMGAFLVLTVNSARAVDTKDIDEVRDKGVLDDADLKIIDSFVVEGVRELLNAKNFSTIGSIRLAILARANSTAASAAAQYSAQFSDSAYKYISEGLKTAGSLNPEDVRVKVIINLLMLADGLENLRLVDFIAGMVDDKNLIVRYWAVHCVADPLIVKKLNSGDDANTKLAEKIAEQLKKSVEMSSPEIITLMLGFAGQIKIPQGEELLFQIADMRMEKYRRWDLSGVLVDADILKALFEKMLAPGANRTAAAQRFAQLYSYALQRYIKGQDILSADDKGQLTSVLVDVEQSCIDKLLDVPQSIIQKAAEQDDATALLQEHNRLLGDGAEAGKLAQKISFDYGKSAEGNKRVAPLGLPEPPKKTQ
jgi:hypothetical protein